MYHFLLFVKITGFFLPDFFNLKSVLLSSSSTDKTLDR